MTVETTYSFLKASLEQFSPEEREKLAGLIQGKVEKKKKRQDPVPSVAEYKRMILASNFLK